MSASTLVPAIFLPLAVLLGATIAVLVVACLWPVTPPRMKRPSVPDDEPEGGAYDDLDLGGGR